MPPPFVETTKVCLFTQQMMDRILGSGDPTSKRTQQLGFTNALNSAANTNGFEQIQTGVARPGTDPTKRILSLYYRNPKLCEPIVPGEGDACKDVAFPVYPYADQLVDVTQYNHVPFTLSRQTYQDACETLNEELARKTIDAAYQLMIAENQYYIETFQASVCNYSNGQSSAPGGGFEQDVKMFNDVGQPNAMAFFKVQENYTRLGYPNNTPIAVGGTGVAAWLYAQGIFQDNNDGFDVSRVPFSMPTFVDYEYDVIAGLPTKRMATWVPGSIQRLEWLKYQEGSEFRINQEHITKTTIVVDGQTFDYTINNDGCNDFVTVTLGRGFDLFIPEATVYDVNGGDCARGECPRQNWITDCAKLDCTDTIDAMEPVVVP